MDWNLVLDIAKEINIGQLIAILLMFWFFYSRLDKKIEKGDATLLEEMKELRKDVQDIDKRLCRLEGAFSAKECCMIQDGRQVKKAE